MPSSPVGGIRNVKILVLYLMQNIGYPMDFVKLNEIVMQTDYILYLDFAQAFYQMVDDDLIAEAGEEDGVKLYQITSKGILVSETLRSDILPSLLDKSLSAALRYLDFTKRGVVAKCESSKRADGRYDFSCRLVERDVVIFSTTLVVDSAERAERLKDNFRDRPEVIYRGMYALLEGKLNYLYDN